MSNIEILKNELISQKQAIEEKGGNVIVKNLNPSPSEITEGIKSISSVDLSLADATESDVKKGKTFYAMDTTLKVGTHEDSGGDSSGADYLSIFTNQAETEANKTNTYTNAATYANNYNTGAIFNGMI